MSLSFLDAGTSQTFDLSAWDYTFGTVTSDGSVVHDQPRALRVASTYASCRKYNVLADAGFRISLYLQVSAWPADHTEGAGPLALTDTSDLVVFGLYIHESTGLLAAYKPGALIPGGSGSHVLTPGTWYRIALSGTIASVGGNEFRVWVDGALDISLTGVTLDRTGVNRLVIGTGTSCITYASDLYVDDSSALTDPGDIRVSAKLPTSANANNFDTPIGDGTVNNRALDETKGMQHAGAGQVAQNYAIEAASAGDVNLTGTTIVGHQAWIWAKAAAVSGTPTITRNGTDVGITLTTSPAYYFNATLDATYPSNAAAVGMVSQGTADDTFLYECGMLIAYTPGAPPAGLTHYVRMTA